MRYFKKTHILKYSNRLSFSQTTPFYSNKWFGYKGDWDFYQKKKTWQKILLNLKKGFVIYEENHLLMKNNKKNNWKNKFSNVSLR